MLTGMRTAIKYFTIGLLAGLLIAPRKGDETRSMLVDRGRDYVQIENGHDQAGDLIHQTLRDVSGRGRYRIGGCVLDHIGTEIACGEGTKQWTRRARG